MRSSYPMFKQVFNNHSRSFSKGAIYRAKDIRFGDSVRAQMLQGVEILATAVGLTLGPKGRTVALEQYKAEPKITKDGFTVARAIDLSDSFQNIGAKLVVDVAENTNKKAGDGTSTATVLACSIARLAMESIKRGCSPSEMREGIMLGAKKAVEHLKIISKPVTTTEGIRQVAVISANGDEHIGDLIATAMDKVGKNGIVTVKEGTTMHDEVEIINGLEIEHGYISPYFINSKSGGKVEFSNCYVLFCDFKISHTRQIVPVLELCLKRNRPLLIVAEDIEGDALSTLVINKLKNNISVCAVKAPSFGEGRTESLKDLAAATGGQVFGDESNLELSDVKIEHLGKADEVVITKDDSLILKGKGKPEEISQRASQIDYLISVAKNEFIHDGLLERKARLCSNVAIIKIGGDSMLDVNERKDRVTDSLNATKAAVEEGIVPGGGTALLRCIYVLDAIEALSPSHAQGLEIIKKALEAPCFTIAKNAGVDPTAVVAKVMASDGNFGYDAMKGTYVDLLAAGIVDPTKVVRTALMDAAGVASLLTAAEVVITRLKEPKPVKEKDTDDESQSEVSGSSSTPFKSQSRYYA